MGQRVMGPRVKGQRIVYIIFAVSLPLVALLTLYTSGRARAAPRAVVINEWSQGDGGSREWVELLVVEGPVDLRGWSLGDSSPGDLTFADHVLWGDVPAGTLLVIYNGADPDPILPVDDTDPADCRLTLAHSETPFFSGNWPAFANSNVGDNPHVRDAADETVHDFSVEPGEGAHPAASQAVAYTGTSASDVADSAYWVSNPADGATPGQPNGEANDGWIDALGCSSRAQPDLQLQKSAPPTGTAGSFLQYLLTFDNAGDSVAEGVIVTDVLPSGVSFTAHDGRFPMIETTTGTLRWDLGTVSPGVSGTIYLTVHVAVGVSGALVNEAVIGTSVTEYDLVDNVANATTVIGAEGGTPIVIDAVYFDTYETNQPDEAVRLRNVGAVPVGVGGWALNDGSGLMAVLPDAVQLPAGGALWLTRDGTAFRRQFGFAADFELNDSDQAVPNLAGSWPGFSDSGDEVILLDEAGQLVDALVYGAGDVGQEGWLGPAVQRYQSSTTFAAEGQILYRRRDQQTAQPVDDTDTAADWSQAFEDLVTGRKVRYPGWDLDAYFFTHQVTESANLTVAIAPDNAYEALVTQIHSAQHRLQIASLTFESPAIGQALVAAVERGVAVTLLLEGSPSGGLSDETRYLCQQLELAGGQCWLMINEAGEKIYDRYKFMHAKYIIVDGVRVVISSENLSPRSLPDDDKRDGTWGRRGVLLITDAPSVVAHLESIFAHDLEPAAHADLLRWTADHPIYGNRYGAPPPGFVPDPASGGITYTVRYSTPVVFTDASTFEIVQAPENSLRTIDSLLGLVGRAGRGDTVLVQQLSERPYWGSSTSDPMSDPNLRLEAYIDAARRGARVRLLLDAYFDDPDSAVSNKATCLYVNGLAATEHLALECALGNPAGLGIHNKMVLVEVGGLGFVHIGSINGTEQSNKGNRELALQVQSDGAYALLASMFDYDWPYRLLLPVMRHAYLGPAEHLLISEVLYDPAGPDGAEFIELVNPMAAAVDLSGYGLGDAVQPTDFEDMRRFPDGVTLMPGQTLLIAFSAADFRSQFGFDPDFEIDESNPLVPNLIDDGGWGDPAAVLQLGNAGDEVILRDAADQVVDVVVYGAGSFPGIISYAPLPSPNANRSLERYPYWRDTQDCNLDFRERALPNPGQLP